MRCIAVIGALSLALALPRSSRADLIPILDFGPGGLATEPLADAVGGWAFHVSSPVTISALGVWDEGGRPLEISHEIGLWTASATLLATATAGNSAIPVASASGEGRWLFADIAPIVLQPGDYVLGAVWGDATLGSDPFRLNYNPFASISTSTSFGTSYEGPRLVTLLPSPILVFPAGEFARNGIFGPNAAVFVPEPEYAGLIALAASAAVWLFRRRARGC